MFTIRTVAVDMRGYGESDKPSGVVNYTIDKLVDDVRELIEALGMYTFTDILSYSYKSTFDWVSLKEICLYWLPHIFVIHMGRSSRVHGIWIKKNILSIFVFIF